MRRAVYFPSSCQKQTTEVFEILPLHPRPPPAISPISGPIAQLDRVPDYESGGRGFESSSVRHSLKICNFKTIIYRFWYILAPTLAPTNLYANNAFRLQKYHQPSKSERRFLMMASLLLTLVIEF